MDNVDGITQLLYILLIGMIGLLGILVIVYLIVFLKNKKKKQNSEKAGDLIGNKQEIQSLNVNENTKTKTYKEYNKNSVFDFMNFEKIEDNMIIQKRGRYLMAIECQGINYDLMSEMEQVSVEQGFMQFLNSLRLQIQLYIQTRTVNLENSLAVYKEKVNNIRNQFMKKQMEYNLLVNSGNQPEKVIRDARFELVKAQNLYEYGLDIIQNTEKMNFNKNILKKNYYVIISYTPEDISQTEYAKEEVRDMAFSELYTKAQSIISSLSVCGINGKVLDSKELIELIYIAYNRDEAEVYELKKALDAGYEEVYSTAPNVLDKRMKEIDKQIERDAMQRANEAVRQALDNKERERRVREKEAQMNELIDAMAQSILEDNEEIIGTETKEEAQKIING